MEKNELTASLFVSTPFYNHYAPLYPWLCLSWNHGPAAPPRTQNFTMLQRQIRLQW